MRRSRTQSRDLAFSALAAPYRGANRLDAPAPQAYPPPEVYMLGNRSWNDWIAQYSTSHQHPVNRACHTIGIPLILLSLALFAASIFAHRLWPIAAGIFVIGWIFQFVGHAFEGKPPEFFSDWRFLLVGTRWWAAKIRGKA